MGDAEVGTEFRRSMILVSSVLASASCVENCLSSAAFGRTPFQRR